MLEGTVSGYSHSAAGRHTDTGCWKGLSQNIRILMQTDRHWVPEGTISEYSHSDAGRQTDTGCWKGLSQNTYTVMQVGRQTLGAGRDYLRIFTQ